MAGAVADPLSQILSRNPVAILSLTKSKDGSGTLVSGFVGHDPQTICVNMQSGLWIQMCKEHLEKCHIAPYLHWPTH